MKLLLWNVKWGEHNGCVPYVNGLAESEPFDLICLTESTTEFLAGRENVLRSIGDYGYDNRGCRQKVSLWSRYGWSDIDRLGCESLPPGRFLAAITNGIRIVGVCIPWREAHVSSGQRNRTVWEDHKAYLVGLRSVLDRYAADGTPVCVLGDYNQRIPPTGRNADVFRDLETAFGTAFAVRTSDAFDIDGEPLIDHVSTTRDIQFHLDRVLVRV